MYNLLIVDDEKEVIELLKIYFTKDTYGIFEASNGLEAYDIFKKNNIDIILLDIMMPKMDGISLVKKIRTDSDVPIIFLTAKGDEIDEINGLGVGGDDYISKPFNPLVVLSRVQTMLRRTNQSNNKSDNSSVTIGEIKLDNISCTVEKNNKSIAFTSKEYKLLHLFMTNSKRVFTMKQLYEQVWEADYIFDDNIIMVYIRKLREKIEDIPSKPKYIHTLRGLGYFFEKKTDA